MLKPCELPSLSYLPVGFLSFRDILLATVTLQDAWLSVLLCSVFQELQSQSSEIEEDSLCFFLRMYANFGAGMCHTLFTAYIYSITSRTPTGVNEAVMIVTCIWEVQQSCLMERFNILTAHACCAFWLSGFLVSECGCCKRDCFIQFLDSLKKKLLNCPRPFISTFRFVIRISVTHSHSL